MKIIVVDDSSTMRRIIINGLKRLADDLVTVEAEDGLDGLAKLTANQDADLVLTDWNMPKLTGIEFLEQAMATGNKIPFILVTTEAEKTNVIRALKAGAKNYITKPFTPDVLVEKIKLALGRA